MLAGVGPRTALSLVTGDACYRQSRSDVLPQFEDDASWRLYLNDCIMSISSMAMVYLVLYNERLRLLLLAM